MGIVWRNRSDGYGLVAKLLHWSVAGVIAVQFVVGYAMDADSSGRGRGRGRSGESGRGRGRGRGDDYEAFGEDTLLTLHVVLGVTILVLAALRLAWRLATPLPPWAETLSAAERRIARWTERALYALMFLIPASGIALIVGDDDLLALHVAAHIGFFVVLALHVGMVSKHQFFNRDHLLRRMT